MHPSLAAVLLLNSGLSMAEQATAPDLSTFIDEVVVAFEISTGTAVRVIEGNEVTFSKNTGMANIAEGLKVDDETLFYIASATKPFTALAALRLHDKGRLDLDRSLAAYFPEIEFDASLNAESITVRHLLTHTSGIESDGMVLATAYSGIHTPEILAGILAEATASEDAPLGTFSYGNEGYNIFSMIIDRELGEPWQSVLDKEVFEPLGMTRTSAQMSDAAENEWTVALPYSFLSPTPDQPLYLEKQNNTLHAAGGMIATADDLARMIIVQLNAGRFGDQSTVKAQLIDYSQQMLATGESSYDRFARHGYGFGWVMGSLGDDPLIHHFGGFVGTHAHLSFMPAHNVGVVILNNEDILASCTTGLIAAYAYADAKDDQEQMLSLYQEMKKTAEAVPQLRQRVVQQAEQLNARPWLLTLPKSSYAGTYSHPLYGDMVVSVSADDTIHLALGNLRGTAAAFTEQDALRVELIPGRGQLVFFNVESGAVKALRYDGQHFERKL